jgi:hypothetical protein
LGGPEGETALQPRRPLVTGVPVAVGVGVALVAAAALVVSLTRDPGLPAHVATHYVGMMAGTLGPQHVTNDPAVLTDAIVRSGLRFSPRIASLEPQFTLVGGRVHQLEGRPTATWFYRDARSEMLLGEAFVGTLDQLGEPDHVRSDREPFLHVFYKTTQTLVFWQQGPVVYALITTLPAERAIALARRLATPAV